MLKQTSRNDNNETTVMLIPIDVRPTDDGELQNDNNLAELTKLCHQFEFNRFMSNQFNLNLFVRRLNFGISNSDWNCKHFNFESRPRRTKSTTTINSLASLKQQNSINKFLLVVLINCNQCQCNRTNLQPQKTLQMERKLKSLVTEQTNHVTNSINEQTLKLAQSIKSILTNLTQRNLSANNQNAPHKTIMETTTAKPTDENNNNNNNRLDTCFDWPESFIQLLDSLAVKQQQQQRRSPSIEIPVESSSDLIGDDTGNEPTPNSMSPVSSLAIDDRDFELLELPSQLLAIENSKSTTADEPKSTAELAEKQSVWLMDFNNSTATTATETNKNVECQQHENNERNLMNLMKFLCKKCPSDSKLIKSKRQLENPNAKTKLKRSQTLPFRFNQITSIDLNQHKQLLVNQTIPKTIDSTFSINNNNTTTTKQDFDEENDEDSGDEQRQSSLLQDDDDQHHQDDEQQQQAASTRRAGSTIESGSLSQLKLKQQQSKTSQSSTANNNNYNEPAPAKPDDGKYSMLQFALYNFREAIEKYSLAQKAKQRQSNERDAHAGDTSTLRGSLKLIEFLRDGGSADATAPASHSTTTSSSSSSTSANGQQQQAPSSKHDWTWRELAEMVKFTQNPIKRSLLKLPSNQDELERRAVECFAAIMQYMGDLPLANNSKQSGEVQCVYLILINCHNYPILRDEIYCQLVKQTTNNRSQRSSDSCLLGWRLFSIVAAYFDCSQMFKPYLMKYLEQAAYDKRRAYHSMASLCLQNLRKTFKFKGRKNVPSIEEIAATTAGRNSKRQIYRLPGGTERVINTNSTTVVDDIIHEICSNMLNVNEPDEMLEYSLYCIADGDLYTMPLNRDEYILDITTELIKNHQQYFLIFCRSIWHYPLRLDSQLYIEVIFNQIAPDYLEGLLLILPKQQQRQQQQEKIYGNPKILVPSSAGSHSSHSDGAPSHPLGQRKSNHHDVGPFRLKMKLVREIARLAALLHRAYGSDYIPHKDEIKYLLPKTIVSLLKQQQRILTSERLSSASSINSNSSSSNSTGGKLDDHPAAAGAASAKNQQHQIVVSSQKWIDLVQENCRELNAIDSLDAKAQFLDIVRHWPLFGSSFFAIKLIQRDLIQPMDFILALNKLGVQMLDTQTHETIHRYQFNEVISTRKVRSEDGALFLDMKCGNLMKRTIIRIQTDQAHEISRLIRQYIDIEISQANKTSAPSNQRRITAGGQQVEQQQHQFEPA